MSPRALPQDEPTNLGRLLVEWGWLTDGQVARALEHARRARVRFGEACVALGFCPPERIASALDLQAAVRAGDYARAVAALDTLSEAIAARAAALGLTKE